LQNYSILILKKIRTIVVDAVVVDAVVVDAVVVVVGGGASGKEIV
jgi:hypothetical protein